MPPLTIKRPRSGFTLVELLVALAIVALLATILVPVIRSTVGQAGITQSQSNMRQIAQGINLYVIDHDEVFLSVGKNGEPPWVQVVWVYLYPDRRWPGWTPQDLDGTVFRSPFVDESPGARSYGMNALLEDRHPERRYHFLPNPADIAILGDVATSSEFRLSQVNPRNAGQVNVVYLSGHVELLRPEDIPDRPTDLFWSGNLPQ